MRVDSSFERYSNTCNVNIHDFPQHRTYIMRNVASGLSKVSFNLNKVYREEKEKNLSYLPTLPSS